MIDEVDFTVLDVDDTVTLLGITHR